MDLPSDSNFKSYTYMKKLLFPFCLLAVAFLSACNKTPKDPEPIAIGLQLICDGNNFTVADLTVALQDADASFTLESKTDASGKASFLVQPGVYSATCTYIISEDGQRLAYSGSTNPFTVVKETPSTYNLPLQKVASRQIVIKEVYSTGCPKEPSGSYSNDAYIILYNNSDIEADATNVVIGMLFPYNAQGNNKFYGEDGKLIYENADWVPAASALWSFTSEVKIPAYSQIVIALYGAVNHTETIPASVDLSNASYYWMSKNEQFVNAKYVVADAIPQSHYLSSVPFNMGNAWLFSNTAPALFIGNMGKAEAEALALNTEAYDYTQGTGASNQAVKFPQAKVIGCVDVFSAANVSTSKLRFPASLNTGAVTITGKLGYTVYRNVDKAATEALPENEGKLVYDYAMGTVDVGGSTDPSGIDAEASIANGAHIIYLQTNSSAGDFHQRKQSSLKK